jgi:hypothetical protein
MTTYRVGYFVGSLSSTSINRVLSKALIRLAPSPGLSRPDQTEADPSAGRHRLVDHQHTPREVQGRGEVLKDAEERQRKQPGGCTEQR